MAQKNNTQVTFDLPTIDHTKIKRMATDQGTSMEKILIDLIHHGLENYQKCNLDHTPNAITRKSMKNIEAGIGLEVVENIDELFKKLVK